VCEVTLARIQGLRPIATLTAERNVFALSDVQEGTADLPAFLDRIFMILCAYS
jgi:hypothetical protein